MKSKTPNKKHSLFFKLMLFALLLCAFCLSKGQDSYAANIIYNSTSVGSSQVVIKNTTEANADVQVSSKCFRVKAANAVKPLINGKATSSTNGIWAKIKLTDSSQKYNTGNIDNPFTVSYKNAGETIDGRSVDVVIQCTKLYWKLRKVHRSSARYTASNVPSNINSPLNGEQKVQLFSLAESVPLIKHYGCYRSGGPYKDTWAASTKLDLTVIIKDSKTGQALSEEIWCDWRDIDQPDHSTDGSPYNTSGWGETITALSGQGSTYHVLVPKSQWMLKNSGTTFYSQQEEKANFNSYRAGFVVKGSAVTKWRAAGGTCGTYLTFPYTKGGALRIVKSSTKPEISTTSDYSLQGAEYKLYPNSACTGTPIKTLITDANGKAYTALDIPAGTYYLKETKASKGFKLNKNPEQVYIANNNITVKDSGILKETPIEVKYEAPTKEASVRRTMLNERYTYTITKKLNEKGEDYFNEKYNNFSITDQLPAEVDFISAKITDNDGNELSGWNVDNNNNLITASKSNLTADGSTIKLVITVKVNSTYLDGNRTWDNTAQCTMDNVTKNSNTVTVKGTIPPDPADLPAPTKKTSKEEVTQDETFNYTIDQPLDEASDLSGQAYAVFDSDTETLTFFRDEENKYTNNQVDGTKTYYTDFENKTPTSNTSVPWYSKRTSIKTVKFNNNIAPKSTAYWFFYDTNLTSIKNLRRLNTENATSLAGMFQDCKSLSSIDLQNFKTGNVTNMSSMFDDCTNLEELDVTGFDTSNVTNMGGMFNGCRSLESIDIRYFDTSHVTNTSWMFRDCRSLTSLNTSYMDTSNVTTMSYMFYYCNLLTSIDVTHFNTSKVTDMSYMFGCCMALTSIDVTHFDTSKVTTMEHMFYYCQKLTNIDVTRFNTSSATSLSGMFSYCSKLTSLDVTHFKTDNVTDMNSMFYYCSSLTQIDVTKFKTTNVTNMANMFCGCNKLSSLNVTYFDTRNVTYMSSMFSNCSSLTTLDVTHFNTSNVTRMSSMFSSCSSLTSLNVTHFDTSNVTDMSYMFSGCKKLTSLNVTYFDTSKVTDMPGLFSQCELLTSIDVSHFSTSNVTNMCRMFYECKKLTTINLSNFDTSNVTDMSYMFFYCTALTSLNVSRFDTSQVTNMSSMFQKVENITSIDVSHFNTSNVTNMDAMFFSCSKLTSLDVSHFDTSKVTDFGGMFAWCSVLSNLNTANFNTSSATKMASMLRDCNAVSTTLVVSKMPTEYTYMCNNAATNSGKKITLKYSGSATNANINTLVATKGSGNVVNGGAGTTPTATSPANPTATTPTILTPSAPTLLSPSAPTLLTPLTPIAITPLARPDSNNTITQFSFSDTLPAGAKPISGTVVKIESDDTETEMGSVSCSGQNATWNNTSNMEATGILRFKITAKATGEQIEWDNTAHTSILSGLSPISIEQDTNAVTVRLKSKAGDYAPHKASNKNKVKIDEEYKYTITQLIPSKDDNGSDYFGGLVKNTTIPADFEEANERSDGKYVLIDNLPDDVEFISANIVGDGITVQKTTDNGFTEGETYKVVAPTEEGVTSERDATIYGWYDETHHRVSIANTGDEALGCFSNLYLLKLEITVKVKDSAKDSWDNIATALVEDKQLNTEKVTVIQQKRIGTLPEPQKSASKENVNPGEEYEYIVTYPLNTYDEDWPTESYESFTFNDALPNEVTVENTNNPSILVQLYNNSDELQHIINGTTQYEENDNIISWTPTQTIPLNGGYLKFTIRVITADKVHRSSWPNTASIVINGVEINTNEVEVGLKNQIYKPEKKASQSQVSKDTEFTYTITQKLNTGGIDYAGNTPFALTQTDDEWYYPNVSFSDVLPAQVDFVSAKGFLDDEEIDAPIFNTSNRTVSASINNVPAKGQTLKFEIKVKANVEEDEWDNIATISLNGYEQETDPVRVESTNNRPQNPYKEASKAKVALDDELEYTITQPINKSGEDFDGEHYADSLKIIDSLPKEVDFVEVKAYYTSESGYKTLISGAHYNENKHQVVWTDEEEYNGQIPLNGGEISLIIKTIVNEDSLIVPFFDNEAKTSIGENSWDSNLVRVKTTRTFSVETDAYHATITPPVYEIEEGGSAHIEYAPQEGYRIIRIEVDGKEIPVEGHPNYYDFDNIKDNHDVKVYAEPINPPKETVIIDFVLANTGIENAQKIAPSETLIEDASIDTPYESPYTYDNPKEIEGYKYKEVASWSAPTKGNVYEDMGHIVYLYEQLPPSDPTKATHLLTIHKICEQTGEDLAGAEFSVDGHTLTTDHEGIAKIYLPSGTYTVEETQAPEGYKITDTTTEVHLIEDKTVTITNRKIVFVPATGLKGIMLGLILGLSLLLSSAFVLLKQKSK